MLASGSFDGNAGIWKAENARLASINDDEQEKAVRGMEVDGEDEEEDEGFRFAVVLEGHESEIKSVAWSANGTFLATCSRDKSVWIWETLSSSDPASGPHALNSGMDDDDDNLETVAVLQEHSADVKHVVFHPTEENCVASGSYDEYIRIWREDLDGEWSCIGVCDGHDGTVWCLDWEPPPRKDFSDLENAENGEAQEGEKTSGPRIISCSDDLTVRLWRRRPKERRKDTGPRIPSIIRSTVDEEDWYEEAKLPQRHERAVYAVAWSRQSGRVVTCGGDGKIVVYKEDAKPELRGNTTIGDTGQGNTAKGDHTSAPSTWTVLYEAEACHGVFEVNHVCWARRADRGRRGEDEEIIVSTGDDGEVRVWTFDDNP